MQSGALLKDVLMVDRYELGTALSMAIVVGQIPFSRNFLETRLRLKEPTHQTLLAVEAGSNLLEITRGDLVLLDRRQASLARDGIYLLDFPGLELRGFFRRPGERVNVISPEEQVIRSGPEGRSRAGRIPGAQEVRITEFLGAGRYSASKIIGRAVWLGRSM
jgi:hypothetical protein